MEAVKEQEEVQEEQVPPPLVVKQLKMKHPDRTLHVADMTTATGETLTFVLVAPLRAEWKKYRDEIQSVAGDIDKVETAIEKAALNLIKWPERKEVLEIFETHPGIIQHFNGLIAKIGSAEVEVRSKKL